MEEASTFTSGLSIAFDINSINTQGSFKSATNPAPVSPGQRGPDVQLYKPGTNVFAGEPEYTSTSLSGFADVVERSTLLSNAKLPISWLTIPAKSGSSAFELLGVMPFGKVFYDAKQAAHVRYGVDVQKGGIFVLRPDGWVGTATELKVDAVAELELYFKNLLVVETPTTQFSQD
jgi:phenol 2-monooxygenase